MKKKLVTVIVVFLFGMFILPQDSYACTKKMDSTFHQSITPKKTAEKNCCANNSSDEEKGCTKNCDNSKCHCSAFGSCSSFVLKTTESFTSFFVSAVIKKDNFHYTSLTNKVFLSVWTPPKIS